MKEVFKRERSQLRDLQTFNKSKGKKPATVLPAAGKGSRQLPSMKCKALTDGSDLDLVSLTRGKVSLVAFCFKSSAESMVESYMVPFREAFGAQGPKAQIVEVNMQSNAAWAFPPVRWYMIRHMRGLVPEERHGLYVFHGTSDATPRDVLELESELSGYVRLVDGQGQVRWMAQGEATHTELKDMLELAEQLMAPNP